MNVPTGAKCSECDRELSEETGWGFTTTLADGAPIVLFCGEHAPDTGKGWTLSDLQRMKDEGQIDRAQREVDLMDQLGPDLYMHMKDSAARKGQR